MFILTKYIFRKYTFSTFTALQYLQISPLLPITNGPEYTLTDQLPTHGHELSVTDASNPKKQLY